MPSPTRLAEADEIRLRDLFHRGGDYDLLVKFYVDNDNRHRPFRQRTGLQVIPGIQDTHTIITFKAFGTG